MARRHRRLQREGFARKQGEHQNLMRIWALRFLLHANWAFRCFFTEKNGFYDEDVQNFLMLHEVDERATKAKELRQAMREQLHDLDHCTVVIF